RSTALNTGDELSATLRSTLDATLRSNCAQPCAQIERSTAPRSNKAFSNEKTFNESLSFNNTAGPAAPEAHGPAAEEQREREKTGSVLEEIARGWSTAPAAPFTKEGKEATSGSQGPIGPDHTN